MSKWISRILDWLRNFEWMQSLWESVSVWWILTGVLTTFGIILTAARDWIAGNEVMVTVIGLLFAVFCLIMGFMPALRERDYAIESFDMTIRAAINYLHESVQHAHEGSGSSNRSAFRVLHELMCSGDLPVVGTTGKHGYGRVQRIPTKRCRKLTPQEEVVPLNTATPEGVRFCLIAYEDKDWLDNWDGVTQPVILEQYEDLLVRSVDLYRIRPRATT